MIGSPGPQRDERRTSKLRQRVGGARSARVGKCTAGHPSSNPPRRAPLAVYAELVGRQRDIRVRARYVERDNSSVYIDGTLACEDWRCFKVEMTHW